MKLNQDYDIFSLGDSAATIELGSTINKDFNDKVLAMHAWFEVNAFDGLIDVIVAYSSLSVIYDPFIIKNKFNTSTAFDFIKQKLAEAYYLSLISQQENGQLIHIPVCYDERLGIDMNALCDQLQLSKTEIIDLHISRTYRIYMIGFLPGFPYMAEVDQRLVAPRKIKPVMVAAGSVGVAGSQTGIYPFHSPGGWNIIGRTPMKIFDASVEDPTKLKTGDAVRFYSISMEAFDEQQQNGGIPAESPS